MLVVDFFFLVAVLISKRTFPCENRGNLLKMESESPKEALSRTSRALQSASPPGGEGKSYLEEGGHFPHRH